MTTFRAEAQAVLEPTRDDAWDAIVALDREHGQRLYGYALRLGIDPGRAADLVQEALLRLWRELGRGTVILSREAWTYRTLARLAADEHRLARRIANLVTRLGEHTAPRVLEIDTTERLAIWAQVDRLPTRQRRAIFGWPARTSSAARPKRIMRERMIRCIDAEDRADSGHR